jgi:hypothetical protein
MALERKRPGDQRRLAQRARLLVAADRHCQGCRWVLAEARAGVRKNGPYLGRIENALVLAVELLC